MDEPLSGREARPPSKIPNLDNGLDSQSLGMAEDSLDEVGVSMGVTDE
jgi:hypothetical protein